QVDLQNGAYGFKRIGENSTKDFLVYFKQLVDKRFESKGNYNIWLASYLHFKNYTHNNCAFRDLDEKLVEGFKQFLLNTKHTNGKNTLAHNSAQSYFIKFKAALNEAYAAKLLV